MQENTLARPSAWQTLLWKDWRQAQQATVAIALGFIGIQVALLAIGFLFASEQIVRADLLAGTIVFGAMAPFVGALGCSGMLIGHERQTGSWAWSSSLPVSWRSALGSKLLVSFSMCLLLALVLSIIPATLYSLGLLVGNPTGRPAPTPSVVDLAIPLVFLTELLLGISFATLLFRNTIAGMVAAVACLLVVQPLLMAISFTFLNVPSSQSSAVFGIAIILSALLLMATIVAFRWRWLSGQNWEFASFLSSLFETSLNPGRILPTPIRSGVAAPSDWASLWWHAAHNSFALRATVVVATLALALLAQSDDMFVVVLLVGSYFLGISTFEGDQTQGRFQFLADRGVSPRKLVLSRLCVAAGIAFALVLLASCLRLFTQGAFDYPLYLPLCVIAFSIAALSSLCFRQTTISSTCGIVVLMIGANLTFVVMRLTMPHYELPGDARSHLQLLAEPVYLLSPLALIIPLAGAFWLAPKWIIREDHKLHIHFWWIALLAVALPILLATAIQATRGQLI